MIATYVICVRGYKQLADEIKADGWYTIAINALRDDLVDSIFGGVFSSSKYMSVDPLSTAYGVEII